MDSLGTILAFSQGLCALVEGLRFSQIPTSQFSPVDGEYSNSISLYPRNYFVHSTISGTIRYSDLPIYSSQNKGVALVDTIIT